MRSREDIEADIAHLRKMITSARTLIEEKERDISEWETEIAKLREQLVHAVVVIEPVTHFEAAEALGQLRIPGAIEESKS